MESHQLREGADPEDLREEIVGTANPLTSLLALAYVGSGSLVVHDRPVEGGGLVDRAPG